MAVCNVCSAGIAYDKVECDGICGRVFHAACLKRSSRVSSGVFTCGECSDVKPCHVLRLVKSVIDTLSNEQGFIAEKVNNISASCAGLQLFSDDLGSFSGKLDRVLDAAALLNTNSTTLLSKLHDVFCRIGDVSASVDDLRTVLENGGSNSFSAGAGSVPIMPAIDGIQRGIKQIKSDFGSWTAVVSRNSEVTSSIAADLKVLLSKDSVASSASGKDPTIVTKKLSSRKRRQKGLSVGCAADDATVVHPLTKDDVCINTAAVSSRLGTDLHPVSQSSATVSAIPDVGPSDVSVRLRPSMDATKTANAVALRPAVLPKCVFVSRIHPDTTEGDVACHISSHCGVPQDVVNCRRIDRPRNGAGSFSASFKIIVPDVSFQEVISPSIWPSGTIAREFIPRHQ